MPDANDSFDFPARQDWNPKRLLSSARSEILPHIHGDARIGFDVLDSHRCAGENQVCDHPVLLP